MPAEDFRADRIMERMRMPPEPFRANASWRRVMTMRTADLDGRRGGLQALSGAMETACRKCRVRPAARVAELQSPVVESWAALPLGRGPNRMLTRSSLD